MHTHAPMTRRGFAMLLVLISLAVATILATAYLASRDNSALIGQNISSGNSAKWAALATLKSGIATLETETDWRANHTNGVVFANAALAGASVDLKFKDLATGKAPSSKTTDVEVTATARVNGVEETVIAYAYVPPAEKDADVDLSEFAVFAVDQISIRDTSVVTRWTKAPMALLGKTVPLGTSSTLAGAITIADNGVAIDGVAYKLPTASSLFLSNNGPSVVQTQALPDTVVVPDARDSGVVKPLDIIISTWPIGARSSGANATILSDRLFQDLIVTTGSTIFIRGPLTITIGDDLVLHTNARLQIRGSVKIIVFDDLDIHNDSRIELEDGATLEMYVGDEFRIDDSTINELGASSNDNSGTASWMDPARFRLYSYGTNIRTWEIRNGAVVKGCIYAPPCAVRIEQNSALYGNVVAKTVELRTGGSVFYDHNLNGGLGFTAFDGPVYDEDGLVKTAVKTVGSLTSTVDGLLDLGSSSSESSSTSGPTPRTVKVEYEIIRFANDVPRWETKASMVADAEEK